MNTGADDDSRSTPTFALIRSSARAIPLAAITSRPATASRATLIIRFSPPLIVLPQFDPSELKHCPDVPAMAVGSLSRSCGGGVGGGGQPSNGLRVDRVSPTPRALASATRE